MRQEKTCIKTRDFLIFHGMIRYRRGRKGFPSRYALVPSEGWGAPREKGEWKAGRERIEGEPGERETERERAEGEPGERKAGRERNEGGPGRRKAGRGEWDPGCGQGSILSGDGCQTRQNGARSTDAGTGRTQGPGGKRRAVRDGQDPLRNRGKRPRGPGNGGVPVEFAWEGGDKPAGKKEGSFADKINTMGSREEGSRRTSGKGDGSNGAFKTMPAKNAGWDGVHGHDAVYRPGFSPAFPAPLSKPNVKSNTNHDEDDSCVHGGEPHGPRERTADGDNSGERPTQAGKRGIDGHGIGRYGDEIGSGGMPWGAGRCGAESAFNLSPSARAFLDHLALPEDVIALAVDAALDRGARSFAYLRRVLEDWLHRGVHSVEDAENILRHRETSRLEDDMLDNLYTKF
ncbi:DnaD domain-containing protein [Gehongia tenuis]|uniref:DnaD domain protein n=1 Tax=Gehongia tenuis TaxID=2763655 RepID=A0A926HPU3_9FIRM|nr:DnaD domain protein [Gehongia tenuis]MBC8530556.1 DnaD domain protein [Gehongia tenuis]